jgi:hypothetical protein
MAKALRVFFAGSFQLSVDLLHITLITAYFELPVVISNLFPSALWREEILAGY